MKNEKITLAIASVAILIIGIVTLANSITKTERVECMTWEQESHQYQGWYATDWQKEQCATYGIKI